MYEHERFEEPIYTCRDSSHMVDMDKDNIQKYIWYSNLCD